MRIYRHIKLKCSYVRFYENICTLYFGKRKITYQLVKKSKADRKVFIRAKRENVNLDPDDIYINCKGKRHIYYGIIYNTRLMEVDIMPMSDLPRKERMMLG